MAEFTGLKTPEFKVKPESPGKVMFDEKWLPHGGPDSDTDTTKSKADTTSSKGDKKIDRYAKFKKNQPKAQAVAGAIGGMGKKEKSTNGQRYQPEGDGIDKAFGRIIDTLTMRRSAK